MKIISNPVEKKTVVSSAQCCNGEVIITRK